MQKFTVFSILLSLAVILGIADIIFNDYLNNESSVTPVVEEDYLPIEEEVIEEEPVIEEENVEEEVDLSEDQAFLEPNLGLELFEESGFSSPVLKDTIFSGLVF